MTDLAARRRFPALNGVRGLAAIAVVLSHVGYITGRSFQSDLLGPFLSRGNFGVTVFFLLSGFLLYRPYVQHSFGIANRPRTELFLWRRAARIFPALWVMVALNLALITPRGASVSDWLSYLFLIQTYNHHDNDPSLTQLWTLGVEILFYLMLPLLGRIVGGPTRTADQVLRRHVAVVGSMAIVALLFNIAVVKYLSGHDVQSGLWLPNFIDWFAAGMVLAVLTCVPAETRAFARVRSVLASWAASRGTCLIVAGLIFTISTLPIGNPRVLGPISLWQLLTQHYLFMFAAFFIMLPLVLAPSRLADRVLGSAVGNVLGNISYSVYLWHPVVMLWLQRQISNRPIGGPFGTMLVLTLVITIAIALLSWYLVERPILRYTPRRLRVSAAAKTAPTAPDTTAVTQST